MNTSTIKRAIGRICLAALAAFIAALLPAAAQAQGQYMPCVTPGQPLLKIPEIVHVNGVLNGVLTLTAEANRIKLLKGAGDNCVAQFVRAYRAPHATLPDYPGAIPAGFPGATQPPRDRVVFTSPVAPASSERVSSSAALAVAGL